MIGVDSFTDSAGTARKIEYVTVPYRDNNYFTFQVNKNEAALDIDLPNYDFGTFLEELNEEAAERAQSLSAVLDPIEDLVAKRVQIRLFDGVRRKLGTLARLRSDYDAAALAAEAAAAKSAENPGDETLTAAAQQANLLRVRAEGALLRQFNGTWQAFVDSLPPDGEGICPMPAARDGDDGAGNGGDGDDADQIVALSEEQCGYVLAELEEDRPGVRRK